MTPRRHPRALKVPTIWALILMGASATNGCRDDPSPSGKEPSVPRDAARAEEALQAIENALEIRPDFAESWFRKASILSRLGRADQAEEALVRWRSLGGGTGS